MRFIERLKLDAGEIATRLQSTKPKLEKEERQLQERVSDLHSQINEIGLAFQRLSDFQPSFGTDFSCPECWIVVGKVSFLANSRSTDDVDTFTCTSCGHTFDSEVPR